MASSCARRGFHRPVVERAGGDVRVDRVAHPVVTAVDPGVDLERLRATARCRCRQLSAVIDRRLRGDRVLVVLVGWISLAGTVSISDLERAVRPDFDFRWATISGAGGARPLRTASAGSSPIQRNWVPAVVVGEPPVAGTIEPVPGRASTTACRRPSASPYLTLACVTGEPK